MQQTTHEGADCSQPDGIVSLRRHLYVYMFVSVCGASLPPYIYIYMFVACQDPLFLKDSGAASAAAEDDESTATGGCFLSSLEWLRLSFLYVRTGVFTCGVLSAKT